MTQHCPAGGRASANEIAVAEALADLGGRGAAVVAGRVEVALGLALERLGTSR